MKENSISASFKPQDLMENLWVEDLIWGGRKVRDTFHYDFLKITFYIEMFEGNLYQENATMHI